MACEDKQDKARCYYLRGISAAGTGNHLKAFENYQKACDLGNLDSCNEAGKIEFNINKDSEKANVFFTKACEGGLEVGCYNAEIAQSRIEYNRFKESCNQQDDFESCMILGYNHLEQNHKIAEGKMYLRKSCVGRVMAGCDFLGQFAEKSDNIPEALSLYKVACDGGYEESCERLNSLKAYQSLIDNSDGP